MLRLNSGDAVVELLPELGGSIVRFSAGGADVLRPAPAAPRTALDTSSFALVPFANRVALGTFSFEGRTVRLKRNFGDHPHVLHGHGWQNAWSVEAATADRAVLSYEHRADDWPWDYRAEQILSLGASALEMTLRLTNLSGGPMPASLGFHPYFPRHAGTELQADVGGVWLTDDAAIPTAPAPANHFVDLARGVDLSMAPFIDHCHAGWSGRALIRQRAARSVELTASRALSFLHVFVPADAEYFCAEPVSAMPDALNRSAASSGIHIIAPDGALTVSMRLTIMPNC